MAELFKVNAPVRKPLFEGVQGENEARSIQFDITPWVDELGDGAVTATAKRSQDSQPYPVTVTKDGNTVTWKPTSTDTAFAGVGSFQLEYTVDDVLAKTCIWSTMVAPSLDPAGDPPDPYDNWLAEMRQIAADAIQAAQDAEDSADDAQASATSALNSIETTANLAIDRLIGGTINPYCYEVEQMYNSSGVLVSKTSTYTFYEVVGLADVDTLQLNFENASGGYTTHYFNQFDAAGNLLSYTPFYDSAATHTVSLLSDCVRIRILAYTSNGALTPSYYYEGASGFTKMSALGDSITFGYTAQGNITQTYLKQIADQLGCNYQKLGVISTPICPNSDYTGGQNDDAFVYRWDQIANDADLIVVAGGTNDYGHNVPLGNQTDGVSKYEQTFYGALNYLINNIVKAHLNAKLVFVTPFHRQGDYQTNTAGYKLEDYVNAIKYECAHYGIKCVDGYSCSGINTIQEFQTANMSDGLHPTQSGHNLIYKNLMPEFAML